MTDARTRTTFQTGRVIRHAVQLLKRQPYAFPLYALVFAGLPSAAMTYLTAHAFKNGTDFSHPESWALLFAGMLVAALGNTILQGLVARAALDQRPPPLRVGDILAWLAVGLVTTLGILAGFVLLVIPGVVLSLAWLVVVPAMATERLGVMDAIRRSNRLTGEVRGTIFGWAIVFNLAQGALGWLAGLVASAIHNPITDQLADPLVQSLTGLIGALGVTAIYHELRRHKDGAWTQSLADVFD